MIKLKSMLILISALLISFFDSTAFAQNDLSSFAEGLPALKIESNGEAETTYSLSLPDPCINDWTDLASFNSPWRDFLHKNNNRSLSILRQAMGTQQTHQTRFDSNSSF